MLQAYILLLLFNSIQVAHVVNAEKKKHFGSNIPLFKQIPCFFIKNR